jgi:hypothetical protein
MLYQPSFCCQCGEKIERREWKIWTSRRFCELCELDHKIADVFPKALIGVGILIGIFGFGSYLQSKHPQQIASPGRAVTTQQDGPGVSPQVKKQATDISSVQSQSSSPKEDTTARTLKSDTNQRTDEVSTRPAVREQVFYCGALTKKGTPCSRRVKGRERCWQHAGQPADARQ